MGAPRRVDLAPDRPTHYRVGCYSLYTRELEQLDELVLALKARGFTKASKSWVLRLALSRLDAGVGCMTDDEIRAVL